MAFRPIRLRPESDFRRRVAAVVASQTARILGLLPRADVQHIGGTSIPGALTKGDVDLVVRVSRRDFPKAVTTLRGLYAINQLENWSATFASFKDDTRFALPFGAQLVVVGSKWDVFVALRDRLMRDPGALAAYNAIKSAHWRSGDAIYRTEKGRWIEELLAGKDRVRPGGNARRRSV